MKQRGSNRASKEAMFAEMRSAPRFSLMMRTAKLLCESGEYVCVVRDISATGARIRLFHQAPPDLHMFLELANGDRYAIERVWQGEEDAGFRFAGPIDVDEFMAEPCPFPRRPLRLRLQRPALVTVGGSDCRAVLVDMSQQGGCVEAGKQFPVGSKLRLEVDRLPLRFGHVCWRRDYTHGLVFQQSFRLDEFARHALALQPFAPDSGTTSDNPMAVGFA